MHRQEKRNKCICSGLCPAKSAHTLSPFKLVCDATSKFIIRIEHVTNHLEYFRGPFSSGSATSAVEIGLHFGRVMFKHQLPDWAKRWSPPSGSSQGQKQEGSRQPCDHVTHIFIHFMTSLCSSLQGMPRKNKSRKSTSTRNTLPKITIGPITLAYG